MNIRIAKGQRFIKINKRERDLLTNAKDLLAEISTLGGGDAATAAEEGADNIALCLTALNATDPTEAEKVA